MNTSTTYVNGGKAGRGGGTFTLRYMYMCMYAQLVVDLENERSMPPSEARPSR